MTSMFLLINYSIILTVNVYNYFKCCKNITTENDAFDFGFDTFANPQMPVQHHHGKTGEDHAYRHLVSNGYEILERNWRSWLYEIDIIARKDGILLFIEVKTRSYEQYGKPEETMTLAQWDRIAHAGGTYMRKINYDWEVGFDLIAVQLYRDGTFALEHYRDVFFPGR